MSYTFKVKQEILTNEMVTEIEKTAELSAVLLSKNALGKDKVELKLENLPLAKRVYKILKEITDLTIGIKYLTSRRLGEHNVYVITVQKQRGYRDFVNKMNISTGVISASEDILKGFIKGMFLACGYIKDPVKEYALDFFIDNEEAAEKLYELLQEKGKKYLRLKREINLLYILEIQKI